MSFITKRERVFNEYDLLDLPPRNEGKLKAYASCTDARAWSHFCSDKTEHLVEIIKRNNDICRPKYLPTDVIVQTLMAAKNAEISRLKRKIEEFEQMIAVYDQLELTCEQKCEIANAHAAIKAANKELDELCLDLDLSGFTEGMDSDAFETGKSRGDEPARYRGDEAATSRGSESIKSRGDEWNFEKEPPKTDTKGNQTGIACPCDASTSAEDARIQEMQDAIIKKDAKLNALRNSLAVMENDVCEPYCIYAHIYTAIEKIFGVLCQNEKYKLYLNLMTAGKDIRCIDIKGKILFKLKVLEKFSQALIAPCTQPRGSNSGLECECLRAEVIERLDFPPASETKQPSLDNKRAQLVADIMASVEMKEIFSKESCSDLNDDDLNKDDIDDYSIDNENLKRLKNLQESYDELMTCYENLKFEKDNLLSRCKRYEELEGECDNLKSQLREYNSLWNEKEHYRRRSLDVDSLKEQYLILADETSNLETQLKAESEISVMKSNTIEDLRNANLALEKQLNDALINFEKEKNTLQCKLKETECTVMCQDQQIKSLSAQIDRFIEQGHDKVLSAEDPSKSLALIDEIESLKQQINNLKDSLFCSEEEKQQLFEQFQDKLSIINDLRMQIEDWKNTFQKEVQRLMEENKALSNEAEEKSMAVENLKNIIDNRLQEIKFLRDKLDENDHEKKILSIKYQELRNLYDHSISSIENEKIKALQSLHLARRESQELLDKVSDYNMVPKAETSTSDGSKSYQDNTESMLLNEIQKLRATNANAISNIDALQEVTKKKSEILENNLKQFARVSEEMQVLKSSHDELLIEKDTLEKDLMQKRAELDNALRSIKLSQKESSELINELDHFKILEDEFIKLKNSYDQSLVEKEDLLHKLLEKNKEAETCQQSLNSQSDDLKKTLQKINELDKELHHLKTDNQKLFNEKSDLQNLLDDKAEEVNSLHNKLESKDKENINLQDRIQTLELNKKTINDNIKALQNEYVSSQTTLYGIRRESAALIDKLKNFEALENDYENLTLKNDSMKEELDRLTAAIKKLNDDNNNLNNENQNLQTINKDIEQSLIDARNQLLAKPGSPRLSSEDIFREIENLKKDKVQSENKIKNLINKLDESEGIISNLTENLLARDDKISILENYINGLKDEIRQLHENLANAIETGEQISSNSNENYDQTVKTLEAHQSRAAHNIKMELAKLKNDNLKLADQLSATKLKTKRSSEDRNKYLSEVVNLQNEREIIANDIKQLEMYSVGDSALSPQLCSLDDIQASLNHIRKSINAKTSKSSSLELTIQKVQNSSQILLSKAEEAKKIVEKEKQKIIMEKEEAVREKVKMENKLAELKEKLEKQMSSDQEVIRDLEARIQNQQLIAQNSFSKLETELQELQSMYRNSISEIEKLKEQLQKLSVKNEKHLKENDLLNTNLKQKSAIMAKIKNELEDLKNKNTQDISIQGELPVKVNISCQTENYLIESFKRTLTTEKSNKSTKGNVEKIPQDNILKSTKSTGIKPTLHLLPNQTPNSVNEVQVLKADVEPTFDFERSSYLNYKMQQLSPGKLEQHSFVEERPPEVSFQEGKTFGTENTADKSSAEGASSKAGVSKKDKPSRPNSANEGVKSEKNNQEKRKNLTISEPLKSRESNDLKVIYKEEPHLKTSDDLSESSKKDNQTQKPVKFKPEQKNSKDKKRQLEKLKLSRPKHYRQIEGDEYDEDDSAKPKLKIDLPRVNNDSQSLITTSEGDKKSTDSEILNIFTSPKRSSLTDTNIYSEGITIIKQETPSLPTISNDNDNLDSYISIGMSSGIELNDRDQEHKRLDDIRNQILELTNREKNLSDDDLELIRRNKNFKKANNENNISYHDLSRVEADPYLIKPKDGNNYDNNRERPYQPRSFALDYILNTVRQEVDPDPRISNIMRQSPRSRSDERLYLAKTGKTYDSMPSKDYTVSSPEYKPFTSPSQSRSKIEQSVMAKVDEVKDYEEKIRFLTNSLEITERDYKKKLSAIKTQYDSNIKNIINEHNQGVKNIQNLHEETLQDIIKIHENEIENLRSMSIEANRKAEKFEKENRSLKCRTDDNSTTGLDEEPTKICSDSKKRRKSRFDSKMLTKTNIVACNVKPKTNSFGPCTCSLDVNISDTIKNIFEQVNVDQRKIAEHTYMKYIANKILSGNVEALDAQELSFLHLKVCRTWKMKLSKEEALQKRIDTLESELINRQRHAQQHIAELDRKVEEEKRRLQEVREAVCRNTPATSRTASPDHDKPYMAMVPPPTTVDADFSCACNTGVCGVEINERRSAGDLTHAITNAAMRLKRARPGSHRAVLAKTDAGEKKERKLYNDELPTRLRRSHDRQMPRGHKK